MIAERHIPNPYPDFDALSEGQRAEFSGRLRARAHSEIRALVAELRPKVGGPAEASDAAFSERDVTLYLGAAGLALVLWEAARYFEHEDHDLDLARACRDDSRQALAQALDHVAASGPSSCGFFCGAPGIHALAAIMSEAADPSTKREHTSEVLRMLDRALADPETELLYGRAGYLHSLLVLRRHTPLAERLPELEAALAGVFDSLERDGARLAESLAREFPGDPRAQSPLAFGFPMEKRAIYFGAAHGLAGVLFAMLQLGERCLRAGTSDRVRGALDFLLALQQPDGNFPVGLPSTREDLVHWCHGAPGVIPTLCKAYDLFGDSRYLEAARRAGECVWHRGLLRKGLGVCHGIAGSVLSLLTLYGATGDERDLYRAQRLCEATWSEHCLDIIRASPDPQRYVQGVPDFPYSLMEGKAGLLWTYLAVQRPRHACFPGYDAAT